ncbi:MAG TPA: condensation domain-containing protein, partial [Anaerolineae bacterium]|nr:condensation domain-containing protein [Anaerolineae bacterium]
EVQRPFDVSQGPLLRSILLRLSPTDHLWLVTIHHLVFDGWSIDSFNRELAALYAAFAAGWPSPLPELPIQYTDFVYWQRARLHGPALERQLSYWRQQLGDELPALQLPTDHPRPALPTSHGAVYFFGLPLSLSEALKTLSRQEGATLFMTLLAAFEIMLYYYTGGQTDFAVGSPVANRQQAETEGLLGLFVNTLVLRANLSGNPTFRELLARVREIVLDGYAHQEVPFQMLVDRLQPKRDMSRSTLFQVWFVLDNEPLYSLNLPGLTVTPVEIDSGAVRHELRLGLVETPTGLKGSLEYRTDLFERASVARLAGGFETLLQTIVAQPEARLTMLVETLFAADERRQKLKQKELEQAGLSKLKQARRKVVRV